MNILAICRRSLFLLFFIPILSTCIQSESEKDKELASQSKANNTKLYTTNSFKYEMSRVINIDVLIEWRKRALANRVVEVFDGEPNLGGKFLGKRISDKDGYITLKIKIPKTIKAIFIRYSFLGKKYVKRISTVMKSRKLSSRNIVSWLLNKFFPYAYGKVPCVQSISPWESKYSFLAETYNSIGVPDNIIKGDEVITQSFLERVDISLPERKPVPLYHPEFITEGVYANLKLIDTGDVWITYLTEGAGYKNTLGFFSYPTGSPPSSAEDIDNLQIIFPNVSNSGSGGGLIPGDKVYLGQFDGGTTISYFLTANGWNSSSSCIRFYDQSWNYTVFSVPEFNPEASPEFQKHNVLFYDSEEEKIVIGFEDLVRDAGSDEDFNDAIFYMKVNPISAISTDAITPIDETRDSDNDGVDDEYDDYPDDDTKAFDNYYPSKGNYGTLLFEDLWPFLGDYDFNDLVLFYNYQYVTNATGGVIQIRGEFQIVATGASQSNGFAIKLPISPTLVSSVTGQAISTNKIIFNSNGTEMNQNDAVIVVSDNVNQSFPKFSNVYRSRSVESDSINITINLNEAVNIGQIGLPPYDPFLIKGQKRSDEIHQIGFGPTSLGDSNLLGKHDDTSSVTQGVYYRTTNYLPWVINVPSKIPHPKERIPIFNAFNYFAIWASSEGSLFEDWYENNAQNIQSNKVVPLD